MCSGRRRNEPEAFLYAFDLLELNGTDLRREPIEVRKATLASILRKSRHGVRLNEHLKHDCGLTVFQHACQLRCEGIVSKRVGSRYRSGRSPDWLVGHLLRSDCLTILGPSKTPCRARSRVMVLTGAPQTRCGSISACRWVGSLRRSNKRTSGRR
jgi:bifunctional non-homologous end joining protein LigD